MRQRRKAAPDMERTIRRWKKHGIPADVWERIKQVMQAEKDARDQEWLRRQLSTLGRREDGR